MKNQYRTIISCRKRTFFAENDQQKSKYPPEPNHRSIQGDTPILPLHHK
jgi:hypothetical protein